MSRSPRKENGWWSDPTDAAGGRPELRLVGALTAMARGGGGESPFSNGNWVRCDAGWLWVSEEPWGWATYHYGRWDMNAEFGWFWVPQTVWAPAWVSWHEGGGYIGWAALRWA